jgi:hypothetical protein
LEEERELFARNHQAKGLTFAYIVEARLADALKAGKPDDEATRHAIHKDMAARVGVPIEVVAAQSIPF